MRINVIGKAHREGTSKRTGNAYNFNEIHYLGVARGVEGQAALTQTLDSTQCPYANIKVGEDYKIEFDNRGYVVTFELITRAR